MHGIQVNRDSDELVPDELKILGCPVIHFEPEFLPAASTGTTGISSRPQNEERLALGGGLRAGFPQVKQPRNLSKTHFVGFRPKERVEFAELGGCQIGNGITQSLVRRVPLRFGLRLGLCASARLTKKPVPVKAGQAASTNAAVLNLVKNMVSILLSPALESWRGKMLKSAPVFPT